jgi:uncharacterized membrane protein YqjE
MIFGAARPRRPRPTSRSSRRGSSDALPHEPLPPKLIPSLRQLISTLVSLAHTRIALAGLELEEEVQRLLRATAFSLLALMLGFLALLVGTFTIVLAVPAEYRVLTMVIITIVYLLAALAAIAAVRSIFAHRPPIFGATLAELEKDKDTLSQMSRAHEAAEAARERAREEDAFAASPAGIPRRS